MRVYNFNSHAHVERDFFRKACRSGFVISTHTLTWSVTHSNQQIPQNRRFQLTRSPGALRGHRFSLTLTRRATRNAEANFCCTDNFNSHAHVERDVALSGRKLRMNISTHTLTWSVTRILLFFAKVEHHFNSHAHVERDVKKTYRDFQKDISTHTLTWSVT